MNSCWMAWRSVVESFILMLRAVWVASWMSYSETMPSLIATMPFSLMKPMWSPETLTVAMRIWRSQLASALFTARWIDLTRRLMSLT